MSRAPSARLRGAATVVVLLAGMGSLQSQDRPAPPSGPPPARNTAADTLEAARDEIRGLKAGREARSMPEGSLPRVAAPEWHGGTAPAPPAVRPVRPISPADTRNPNWLIEALQPTDAADVMARDREDSRSARTGAQPASDRTAASRSRAGGPSLFGPRGESERSPNVSRPSGTGAITNPLTAYLDDWMTPQDLALLKPGLGGRSAGVPPPPDLTLPMGGLPAGPQSTGGTFRGPDPVLLAPAGDRPGTVRENPFLAALNAPVAGSAVAAETSRLAVPAPGSAAGPAPSLAAPPSPPPPPRIPDFARPAADEKYFKPLKRF